MIFLIVFTLLVWQTYRDLPLERLEGVSPGGSRWHSVQSTFEAGAKFRARDYHHFYLITSEGSKGQENLRYRRQTIEKHLKELEEQKIIKREEKQVYFVETDLRIGPLLINDCELTNCFQHRLEFDSIPSLLWKGLIGVEDYRFLNHFGIDLKAIARAIIVDVLALRFVQGASTLTQQLVKNLYLSNEKTLTRKIKEIIAAVYIDAKFSKENILEAYFNEVYWGAFQGIQLKGIYAASLFYFAKTPEQLNSYEVALLIGLLKGPAHYHPVRRMERLKTRTEAVYQRLVNLGLLSEQLGPQWTQEQWDEWGSWMEERARGYWLPIIADITKKQKSSLLSPFEEYVLYQSANERLRSLKSDERFKDLDLAVKIQIQNFDKSLAPYTFYSKRERNLVNAIEKERHQIGSAIKPFIYHLFFRFGYSPNDLVLTDPLTLELISGSWSPREAGERATQQMVGEVELGEALLRSLNRPVIRLAEKIGFDFLEEKIDEIFNLPLRSPLSQFPAQLLGAVEFSINEISKLIETLIREECRLGPEVFLHLADPTRTTVRRQVEDSVQGLHYFGKTGTSNMGRDSWFIFFDGEKWGVVWLGVEGPTPQETTGLYGSTAAFPIFQQFFSYSARRFPEFHCPR